MIRTFAIAALIAAPGLALAQTAPAAPAAAEATDAPDEAPPGPFEMIPVRPPASTVAFSAPTAKSLLEHPARPDMPRTFDALQYEASIRRGAREADQMEGPLNGQWRLVDGFGRQLYAFQLTSSASRGEPLSGAWRNPNVARSPVSAGFIALIGYDGSKLDLRFTERTPADLVTVTLAQDPTGRFAGQLTKDGANTPVRLERQP
jgi:hypothetical protein